jgi:hypothetical protein
LCGFYVRFWSFYIHKTHAIRHCQSKNTDAKTPAPTPTPRPSVVLSCEPPHSVLSSSLELEDLLGFRADEVAQKFLRNITRRNIGIRIFQSLDSSCTKGLGMLSKRNSTRRMRTKYSAFLLNPSEHRGKSPKDCYQDGVRSIWRYE